MRKKVYAGLGLCAASVFLLTGCGTADNTKGLAQPVPDCAGVYAPGATSKQVAVAKDSEIPKTLAITADQAQIAGTQVSASSENSDAKSQQLQSGSVATVALNIYDGYTGDMVYASGANRAGGQDFVPVPLETGASPLGDVLLCAHSGDRLTAVFSQAESMAFVQQFGVTPGANAIAVIDVSQTHSMQAEGKKKLLPTGFPGVTRDESGQPGIVLPPHSAPEDTRVAASIVGDGQEVVAEDAVVAQIYQIDWQGTELNSTWSSGAKLIQATDALHAELQGFTVGSQVVILQAATAEQPASVIVVDILAAG